MTKFKPILFSTPMVEALLEGRKTITRRVIDPQPKEGYIPEILFDHFGKRFLEVRKSNVELDIKPAKLKYQVGDILWVREKFRVMINCETKEFSSYEYFAGNQEFYEYLKKKGQKVKWKPSIFMTKEA